MSAILKNGREKQADIFQTSPEKGGEAGKSGAGPKNSPPSTPASPPSPPFFPVALEKCQFLVALPSVDGAKNVTRFIMVQGILSQPMVVLSASVGELTLSAE